MKLSLKQNSTPVELEQGDGKPTLNLLMREMNAAERDSYMNSMIGRMEVNALGETSRIKSFEGMHADLLSRCLFQDGKAITKEVIQTWPASVTAELFTEANKLNQINKATAAETKAAAKNA